MRDCFISGLIVVSGTDFNGKMDRFEESTNLERESDNRRVSVD